MIEFRLTVSALGRNRFGYSPLAEVACSVHWLQSDSPAYVLRPWLRETKRVLTTTTLDLLCAVAPARPWLADFLFALSTDPKITIEQQLDRLAALPSHVVRHDLEEVWQAQPMPPEASRLMDHPADGMRRLADAIWSYWQVAIAKHWPRIRAVIEDDVAHRASRLLTGGLFDLFAELHPEITLQGQRLLIDKPHHADHSYAESELTLVPSVFAWPHLIVGHAVPGRFELFYTARGLGRVWETLPTTDQHAEPLRQLLGRTPRQRAGPARNTDHHHRTRRTARPQPHQRAPVGAALERTSHLPTIRTRRALPPDSPCLSHRHRQLHNRQQHRMRGQRRVIAVRHTPRARMAHHRLGSPYGRRAQQPGL